MTRPALFLGRDREVAEFCDALSAAAEGSPQIVLVRGDAGIGKTTFVRQVVQRAAERGFTVAVGHCLDIEADISLAPVVEAVRTLLSGIEDLEGRPSARRMLTLLDPQEPHGPESFRVLDDLRQTVLEASTAAPLMVVLEDMHWTDRSTQDFVMSLTRTARGRLLLLLTFRSEDLHRRHSFRTALAELGRAPGTRHVDLGALDRASIGGIVTAHAGRADESVVDAVLLRSEGNPLYVEELLDADHHGMPELLSDLFLARVDALGEDVRALLRLASVSGTRLDTDTLASLAGLEQETVDALLREALDAHVLRQAAGSLEFRHGLLREAVYDDLLPDERARIHGDLAGILQALVDADPGPGLTLLSRLAFHWSAAHDLPRCLQASERAGMVATRIGTAESITHLEQALSLWDSVPNAETLVGRTKIELVVSLAVAMLDRSDGEAWYALTHRAVGMLEADTPPRVACRAYFSFALAAMHNDDVASAPEAIRLAVSYAGDVATEEQAFCFAAQALLLNVTGRFAAGLEASDRAIGAAMEMEGTLVGRNPRLLALMFKTNALYYLGRVNEACAVAERSVQVARSDGMVGEALVRVGQHAEWLLDSGRVLEAMAVAREGRREALAVGLPVMAANCGEPLVTALTWQGRFDEAETLVGDMQALGLHEDEWWLLRADLALARGDSEAAARVTPAAARNPKASSPFREEADALILLRLAAIHGDEATCLAVATSYLPQVAAFDSPLIAADVARMGFQALSLARAGRATKVDPWEARSARLLEQARAGLTDEWRGGFHGVQLVLAQAYAARVAGEPAMAEFREAAALSEPFGAFFALEPRLDLAQELLAHGGRDEGKELLVDCWAAAHDLGARGLEARALRVATRARVPLPTSATSEGPLSRLTPRERDVLDLLATGATNKAIADTLFISQKTVSVHVSNVLSKLGVENRGEAAALARRLER